MMMMIVQNKFKTKQGLIFLQQQLSELSWLPGW